MTTFNFLLYRIALPAWLVFVVAAACSSIVPIEKHILDAEKAWCREQGRIGCKELLREKCK